MGLKHSFPGSFPAFGIQYIPWDRPFYMYRAIEVLRPPLTWCRYGRFGAMDAFTRFPDLRYGRKNRMAVLVFFWTCAMDVSVLWPNPYNRYGRKTLWRIPKTQISKNQLALWTFRLYGRRPSVSAMDVHNAGHSGMADRPNRYGRP